MAILQGLPTNVPLKYCKNDPKTRVEYHHAKPPKQGGVIVWLVVSTHLKNMSQMVSFFQQAFQENVDEGQFWDARVAHHLLVNCCWTN